MRRLAAERRRDGPAQLHVDGVAVGGRIEHGLIELPARVPSCARISAISARSSPKVASNRARTCASRRDDARAALERAHVRLRRLEREPVSGAFFGELSVLNDARARELELRAYGRRRLTRAIELLVAQLAPSPRVCELRFERPHRARTASGRS